MKMDPPLVYQSLFFPNFLSVSMFKSILTFMLAALAMVVVADQIYIYGPPSNGIYHPKDIMDIRYHGKLLGLFSV